MKERLESAQWKCLLDGCYQNILIFVGGAGNAELASLNACKCAGKAGNRPWLQSAYLEEVFLFRLRAISSLELVKGRTKDWKAACARPMDGLCFRNGGGNAVLGNRELPGVSSCPFDEDSPSGPLHGG
ncbi:MAG: hypothetical protein MK165_03745 [Pirellulaceae bacterium]|nr:hypothetical protein [Pirellulaceae bacterium]